MEFGPLAWVTSAWQWSYKERNFKGLRLGPELTAFDSQFGQWFRGSKAGKVNAGAEKNNDINEPPRTKATKKLCGEIGVGCMTRQNPNIVLVNTF